MKIECQLVVIEKKHLLYLKRFGASLLAKAECTSNDINRRTTMNKVC